MVLTSLSENDPRLRAVCADVTRQQLALKEQQAEIDGLLDYMMGRGNKGVGTPQIKEEQSVVGLSANQVGLMKQLCVVDLAVGRKGYHDLHVLVNPKVVWHSKAFIQKNEGCVNFPTIRGVTQRWKTVRVEAHDRSGNEITLKLTGWPAVLLQHEIDHLSGRLFIDRLPDPTQADLVGHGEYAKYRKQKGNWPAKTDVSDKVVTD